jgi:hypothetical protein
MNDFNEYDWSDTDTPLIAPGSWETARIGAWVFGLGAAATFAALVVHLIGWWPK